VSDPAAARDRLCLNPGSRCEAPCDPRLATLYLRDLQADNSDEEQAMAQRRMLCLHHKLSGSPSPNVRIRLEAEKFAKQMSDQLAKRMTSPEFPLSALSELLKLAQPRRSGNRPILEHVLFYDAARVSRTAREKKSSIANACLEESEDGGRSNEMLIENYYKLRRLWGKAEFDRLIDLEIRRQQHPALLHEGSSDQWLEQWRAEDAAQIAQGEAKVRRWWRRWRYRARRGLLPVQRRAVRLT